MDTILRAVRDVVAGQSTLDPSIVDFLVKHHRASIDDLSRREADVLELMADGLSNRAIADRLNISVKSVEKCITAIFRNLDLKDQSQVDRRVAAALSFQRYKNDGLEYDRAEGAASEAVGRARAPDDPEPHRALVSGRVPDRGTPPPGCTP